MFLIYLNVYFCKIKLHFFSFQICFLLKKHTMSQKKMTTENPVVNTEICPAQKFLKLFSGKLKPEIFCLAVKSNLRFSSLLREIKGSNKQSLAIALKELEQTDLLEKVVIKQKPLHIEYYLTEKGKSFIPVFKQLENLL